MRLEMQICFNNLSLKHQWMNVKIDTREKFHVITILETELTGNMTADFAEVLNNLDDSNVKNFIIHLGEVTAISPEMAKFLLQAQQKAYEKMHSFVICNLQPAVEEMLDKDGLLELMNVTPTESEAWDIVQMEEIERELF
jgi:anti-anti-sigma factor